MEKWSSKDFEHKLFGTIIDIAVSPDNYIYMNSSGLVIQKFDMSGNLVAQWKYPQPSNVCGCGPPPMEDGMAVDKDNNLFILINESGHQDNAIGNYIYPYLRKSKLDSINYFAPISLELFGGEKCSGIVDIALDSEGNIFVLDGKEACVYKIDGDGNLLAKWGTFGSDDGEFDRPEEIVVDRDGNVYVVDTGNCRVQKFAPVSGNSGDTGLPVGEIKKSKK